MYFEGPINILQPEKYLLNIQLNIRINDKIYQKSCIDKKTK